jgi:hypothetical protein
LMARLGMADITIEQGSVRPPINPAHTVRRFMDLPVVGDEREYCRARSEPCAVNLTARPP